MAIWVLGAVYALFATVSVTELSTMLPQAGGWYIYSRRAFGDCVGFLVGCCDWMIQSVAIAYMAVALGEFAAALNRLFTGHIKLVAVASLCFLTFVNWLGIRVGSRTQQLTSLVKALALLGFVVACFARCPKNAVLVPAINYPTPTGSFLVGLFVAFQSVIITYDGWYAAIYFVEEDENPSRNMPRSAIGGVFACIAIFLLVNSALLHILTMSRLAGSQMPAADAAMLVFGPHGRVVILGVSVVIVISTINASLLIAPRILFGMARDNLFFGWATSINDGGTPSVALLLSAIVSAALVLGGSFETLVAIASFLFVMTYMSGFIALLALRWREPELLRPFKTWGYPWTALGVLLASAIFLISSVVSDLKHCLFSLAFIAFSCAVYFRLVRKEVRDW